MMSLLAMYLESLDDFGLADGVLDLASWPSPMEKSSSMSLESAADATALVFLDVMADERVLGREEEMECR